MKKIFLITAILICPGLIYSQNTYQDIINKTKKTITDNKPLTNTEVIKGLKEALSVGTNNSAKKVSAIDGYFKNPLIKILLPPEAVKMEKTLRGMGMGQQVDKCILTLNRAAEEAAKQAAPIFLNAITQLTITDGMNILKGANNAATQYLKSKTINDLKAKFKPVVRNALQKVQITKYWNPLMTKYNKIPMVQKINPNLEDYVTNKALEGLFKTIEGEELKIRKDPLARISDILRKVFGSLDKK
ncbi:MAG: DUF4197 domain-containing protein [Bacteroidales bacterium]|nr:DUF4197 domain-containing protein [Bacteroidales bacterium]